MMKMKVESVLIPLLLATANLDAAGAFVVGGKTLSVSSPTALFLSEQQQPPGEKGAAPPPPRPAPVKKKPAPRPLEKIFRQNARWVETKMLTNPDYFTELGSGHHPKYLWIGSADARVPANVVMGEDAGAVFTLRNVANLVVNTDVNLMSGLQYAINYLKIPDIIVCGHYECGGIRASMTAKDHIAPLENWLRNIRDVYRLHKVELDSIKDPEIRHKRLVELNVIEQCVNLYKTGAIQRRNLDASKDSSVEPVRIHPVVFDPKTGLLTDLQVDFSEYMGEINSIYGLYES